jgi:hypothetical protein
MYTRLIFILTLTLCIVSTSCQHELEVQPEISATDETGYVRGAIQEEGDQGFTDFEITIGRKGMDGLFDAPFWQGNVSQGELGPTLIVGAYNAFYTISSEPFFGLQFWSASLPANREWNSEELDAFFSPGTTFEFGQGAGKVDLMLSLPIGNPTDINASRSSFLAEAEGSLSITKIEDFDYPVYSRTSERRYGKLVHCTFSGKIGKYDSLADQADGDPSFFQTDEEVEILNGEAVFYVNYDER